MCTLELKNAYLSVSVLLEDRKYLHFIWDGSMYELTCLPFGLCNAPRTFTKFLRLAMAHLRKQGIRSIIFLDDIPFMYQSREGLLHHVGLAVQLLESLGFTINREKSQLTPSQNIQFLGLDEVLLSRGENHGYCMKMPGFPNSESAVNPATITAPGQISGIGDFKGGPAVPPLLKIYSWKILMKC